MPEPAPAIIVGVDTHTDTHTAVAIDLAGRRLADVEVSASPAGYRRLLEWANTHGTIDAVESSTVLVDRDRGVRVGMGVDTDDDFDAFVWHGGRAPDPCRVGSTHRPRRRTGQLGRRARLLTCLEWRAAPGVLQVRRVRGR